MENAKLYSAQDIEKLKQKIATYRDTLTTLKSGNPMDDYLFMKSELTGIKTQVSHLEGVIESMNGNRGIQIEEYEQQIENFTKQMGSLNQAVEDLYQDLSIVTKKLLTNHPEKVNSQIDVQESIKTANQVDETIFIEETTQKKEQTPIASIQPSNRPLSFKQLKSFVGKAIDTQNVPNAATSTVGIGLQDNNLEPQFIPKQRFPAVGVHPNQIYNGLYRDVSRVPAIHFTNVAKNQEVPLIENDHSNPMSKREKKETVMAYSEEIHPIALVEEKKALIIEEKESLVKEKEYLVEEKEAPIEIAYEMKRQQHKNKETLSLLSFFRKKY